MAQSYDKYELDNDNGKAFRLALNDILEAAATQNSGLNSPNTSNTSYPYQVWVDETNDIVKIRDAATAGSWYSLYSVDADGKPTGAVAYGNYTIATNDTAGNGGTPAITVDTSQRVGINTTVPANDLDVLKTASGSTTTARIGATAASGANNATLILNNGGTGNATLRFDYEGSTNQASIGVSASNQELTFSTGGSTAATIDSSGRLLINDTTTGAKGANSPLQVKSSSDANCVTLKCRDTNDFAYITFTDNDASEGLAEIYANRTGANTASLSFGTNGGGANSTERMRINSNGALLAYGDTSVIYASTAGGAGTTHSLFNGRRDGNNVGDGTEVFKVTSNGNIYSTNTSITNISDVNLKENIVDAKSQWDDIHDLRFVNFNFKAETGHDTHKQLGLIAQEVEQVCPGVVQDITDELTGEVTKGVTYTLVWMKAVKALQEAMERIEELEAKVAALESA